jgi:hypothetical protein
MSGIHRKRFRGRIVIVESNLDFDVELWVEEHGLTVATGGKPLGTWPLDLIQVDRVASARFVVTLEDESVVFIAADPIAFSYEGLQWVETARARSKRRRLRRRRKQPAPPRSLRAMLEAKAVPGPRPDPEPEPWSIPEPERAGEEPPPVEPPAVDVPELVVELPELVEEPTLVAADPFRAAPHAEAGDEIRGTLRRHTSVLGRVRSARNGQPHEHEYQQLPGAGGLSRRICDGCGHISIALTD